MYGTKFNAITTGEEADQTADGAAWAYSAPAGGMTTVAALPVKAATSVTRQGAVIGLRAYCTGIQISSDSLTASTEVVVLDGVTVIWRAFLRTGVGSNVSYDAVFQSGALRSSPGAALNVQLLTAPGAAVYVNAQGYVGN